MGHLNAKVGECPSFFQSVILTLEELMSVSCAALDIVKLMDPEHLGGLLAGVHTPSRQGHLPAKEPVRTSAEHPVLPSGSQSQRDRKESVRGLDFHPKASTWSETHPENITSRDGNKSALPRKE